MSKQAVKHSEKWQGLSTDDKPLAAAEGAEWRSVDNGEVWYFHEGMWEIDPKTEILYSPH